MKRLLQNTLLLLFSLILCVGLCEGVFYFLNSYVVQGESYEVESVASTPNKERLDFFQYHSVYGYVGQPNIRKKFFGGKYITHNSKGFRGGEFNFNKDDGVERIVLIGDSQTWGWAVGDNETIDYYTREILNRRVGESKYETLNFGATGYGVDQSYLRFISEGIKYNPDYVALTFFSDNDIWETSGTEAYGVQKPYIYAKDNGLCVSNVPPRRATGWPSDQLGAVASKSFDMDKLKFDFWMYEIDLAQSQTALYLKSRSIKSSFIDLFSVTETDPLSAINKYIGCLEKEAGPDLPDWQAKIDHTISIILKIKAAVEGVGAKFILVAKPMENEYAQNSLEYNYAYVLTRLKEEKVDVVDLYTEGKLREIMAEHLFIDFGHLSPVGNYLIAETIANIIEPEENKVSGTLPSIEQMEGDVLAESTNLIN